MENEILELIETFYIELLVQDIEKKLYRDCNNKFLKVKLFLKYKFKLDGYGRVIK